jgi:outer membrane translocation and assembly module TamA
MLRIGQEFNKFNGDGEYEITETGLQPVYKDYDFTRLELRWREYIPMFVRNHTLTVSLRGGTILGPTVDEFFDFYAGGLIGMRGYPFYSLGGNDMAVVGLEYRFPLVRNIDVRIAQLYFDKLYASVFTDYGNAWSNGKPAVGDFKADVGVEFRLETFSYYAYPTRFFFSAAYGLNQFDRYVEPQKTTVIYGKEWFFHFGVLFDYDLF